MGKGKYEVMRKNSTTHAYVKEYPYDLCPECQKKLDEFMDGAISENKKEFMEAADDQ